MAELDPRQVADLAAAADTALGGVDVLVNNAAVVTSGHGVADVDYETWQEAWREIVDVNLFGAANLSYCVARRLIDRGVEGAIVNVGSVLGLKPTGSAPAYSTAKAAIIALTKAVAEEVAHLGIRVNAICPGYVDTPLLSQLTEEVRLDLGMHPNDEDGFRRSLALILKLDPEQFREAKVRESSGTVWIVRESKDDRADVTVFGPYVEGFNIETAKHILKEMTA